VPRSFDSSSRCRCYCSGWYWRGPRRRLCSTMGTSARGRLESHLFSGRNSSCCKTFYATAHSTRYLSLTHRYSHTSSCHHICTTHVAVSYLLSCRLAAAVLRTSWASSTPRRARGQPSGTRRSTCTALRDTFSTRSSRASLLRPTAHCLSLSGALPPLFGRPVASSLFASFIGQGAPGLILVACCVRDRSCHLDSSAHRALNSSCHINTVACLRLCVAALMASPLVRLLGMFIYRAVFSPFLPLARLVSGRSFRLAGRDFAPRDCLPLAWPPRTMTRTCRDLIPLSCATYTSSPGRYRALSCAAGGPRWYLFAFCYAFLPLPGLSRRLPRERYRLSPRYLGARGPRR